MVLRVLCAGCSQIWRKQALCILGVTMTAWPGDDEAQLVDGPWTPSKGAEQLK